MCSGESHTDASFSSFSTLQSYLLSICQHFLQSVFDLSVSDLPPLSLPPSILLHSLCHSVIFSFPSSPSVFTLCPLFYFCPPPPSTEPPPSYRFLCLKNKNSASVVFSTYTEKHPSIEKGPPFVQPLLNFIWFLLLAVDG